MKYEVRTTAQVERIYHVEVADDLKQDEQIEQAHKRVRAFMADADSLREGVVTLIDDETKNITPEQVKKDAIKALPDGPKAVTGAAAAS